MSSLFHTSKGKLYWPSKWLFALVQSAHRPAGRGKRGPWSGPAEQVITRVCLTGAPICHQRSKKGEAKASLSLHQLALRSKKEPSLPLSIISPLRYQKHAIKQAGLTAFPHYPQGKFIHVASFYLAPDPLFDLRLTVPPLISINTWPNKACEEATP